MFKALIILILASFSLSLSAASFRGICAKKLKQRKFLKVHTKYATGFSIKKYKGFYLLTINKTWDNSKKPQEIFLVENRLNFPSTCRKYFNIDIPVKSVASFSTSHLPAFELLEELKSVKAFSNLKFAYNEKIQAAVKEGNIFELGSPPSSERLLALRPDAIFSYSTTDPSIEGLGGLLKLKLPVVFISEFREKHPLGRAEWVKVFGLFYKKLDLAKKKFREIEKRYNDVTISALLARPKRKVLIGEMMKGVWKAPGGKSDLVSIITDAGGDYIWSSIEKETTMNINIETVLIEGKKAEIWLPNNMSANLKELKLDNSYTPLKFLNEIDVYNNNNRLSPGGGNDFWETALMRPDLLIQDFVRIFHPLLLPNHDLAWYKELE